MNGKKLLLIAFKLAISGVSLWIVFSKADPTKTLAILKSVGPLAFIGAALLYMTSLAFSTYRWKLLLPENFRYRKLFSLYLIGSFFSTFLPGVIGGDVVKAYYLNKDANKLSLTMASVFMDRYLGYVSLMLIGISVFPYSFGIFGNSVYRWAMPLIFCAFIVGSILFFGLKVGKRFNTLKEFYDYFSLLGTRKTVIVSAVLISAIVQLIGFSAVALLAIAMGEKIPFVLFLAFLPIVITLTSIPISISGLGVREGSFVLLLGYLGIRPEAATSLSLLWFFSTFLGSLPGLIAYMRYTEGPPVV